MNLNEWVLISMSSLLAIVFWLAGFSFGDDGDQAWIGIVIGAVPAMTFILSFMAIVGIILLK